MLSVALLVCTISFERCYINGLCLIECFHCVLIL
ncbi:hypothetical protein SAMN05443253_105139 [Bacillus sp. OK048]|nr:hypothetical protein SAMN05443253_105139 [Bacillus sp. OK048]